LVQGCSGARCFKYARPCTAAESCISASQQRQLRIVIAVACLLQSLFHCSKVLLLYYTRPGCYMTAGNVISCDGYPIYGSRVARGHPHLVSLCQTLLSPPKLGKRRLMRYFAITRGRRAPYLSPFVREWLAIQPRVGNSIK